MSKEDVLALERALLGVVILDNAAIDDAERRLEEQDFVAGKHRVMFRGIVRMARSGMPVTLITLVDELSRHGELEDAGGAAEVSALTTDSAGYKVDDLINRVLSHAIRRRILVGAQELIEQSGQLEPDEMIGKLEKLIAGEERSSNEYGLLADHLQDVIREAEDMRQRGGALAGLSTGLSGVDRYTLGLQSSDLIVVGARASIGKTALALTMASNIAKRSPVGFFSLEMNAAQLTRRGLSMHSGVDVTHISTGNIGLEEMSKMQEAASLLYNRKMYILDRPRAYLSEIISTARRMKRRDKIKALFIDYVGLIRVPGFSKRNDEISFAAKELKQLARDLEIPVVLLAQMNRNAEGKRPTLAELKESGALEEDSDIVMLLHRDRDSQESTADVYIEKNRNGQVGHVPIGFSRELTLFTDLVSNAHEM